MPGELRLSKGLTCNGFGSDWTCRYLDHETGFAKPYLERNFQPPQYIGRDEEANIDNISSTLDSLDNRASLLAESEVLKLEKSIKFDPNKVPDPLDFASKPTNPSLQTIELF